MAVTISVVICDKGCHVCSPDVVYLSTFITELYKRQIVPVSSADVNKTLCHTVQTNSSFMSMLSFQTFW